MTDEHLDRLVRDADPYRPDVIGHLDGAQQTLLEEIMSVPTLQRVLEPPPPHPTTPRSIVRRSVGALAAAALFAGILAVPAMLPDHRDDRQAVPAGTPIVYSAAAIKAAEENPRLLINQPGWTVTTVYGFAKQQGTIAFRNGQAELEMNWYPADAYDDFYADRLRASKPEPVTIDSWSGHLFTYSAGDFAVTLRPRDGVFVELRTRSRWTRDTFERLLTDVVRVDARTWLAALPAEVVTPDRVAAEAAIALADVPLPPRFDIAALGHIGINDPYQFGTEVTGSVGCAWVSEWLRAKRIGDDAALKQASDALLSSHKWRVLHQMNDKGDWPEVFWGIADKVAAGTPPTGYVQALGCD
ncbi:hypothetical protein D7147_08830 [Micromonospora musae]|uniref:Uncharacterized protein n=1 Tax=Micromonospora musae TaxID=1894970 RepID=A0ABX9RBG3_9ACTN|nr:hypothetical protein [Micromonospora musae]RKN20913.1 hypothetical protein D7147_08830 [Micromonospora musae]